MAITVVVEEEFALPQGRMVVGYANLGVYATSGVAATAANFSLGVLTHLALEKSIDGHSFVWNKTGGLILAFTAGDTEVTNATDLSSKVFRFCACGPD